MIDQANLIGAAAAATGSDNLRVPNAAYRNTQQQQQKLQEGIRARRGAFETNFRGKGGPDAFDQYEWKVGREFAIK